MHFVYAIYNRDYGKLYIGETSDLDERLRAHNDHRFARSYTARFYGVWELIYREECIGFQEARKREKELKSYRGREFLNKFIPG